MEVIVEGFPVMSDPYRNALPTWLTIRLGVHKSLETYLASAKAKGHRIGRFAARILPGVEWAQEESDLELVEVFDFDVGMVDGYMFDQFAFVVTSRYDFDLCPDEAGPAVRDQYLDQPMGERRGIAMKPRAASGTSPKVFHVDLRPDGPWLRAGGAHRNRSFNLGIPWLFARRKRPASQG